MSKNDKIKRRQKTKQTCKYQILQEEAARHHEEIAVWLVLLPRRAHTKCARSDRSSSIRRESIAQMALGSIHQVWGRKEKFGYGIFGKNHKWHKVFDVLKSMLPWSNGTQLFTTWQGIQCESCGQVPTQKDDDSCHLLHKCPNWRKTRAWPWAHILH